MSAQAFWRMKEASTLVCGLTLWLLLLCSPAFAFNQNEPFDVEADTLTYRHATRELIAEGHVRVTQTSSSVTADYLLYDRSLEKILARGRVVLRDKKSILSGEELHYDVALEKGEMSGAKGYGAPWLFQGAGWQKEGDLLIGQDTAFTSCSLPDAHYHFLSDRISLIEDHFFWGWGNTLRLDHTPVFYSPFLYKSLEPRRIALQATPGTDSVKGAFAKTQTTIRFKNDIDDRLLYDYYTKSGSGIGNEFFYNTGDRMKGSLFGYYINPKGSPELVGAPNAPQYNFRFYHWQRLSNTFTIQSNTNLRKNVSFNNQFFSQDYNQSVNDLTSSIALTQQTQKVNQRLVLERLDAPDDGADPLFADTHIQEASLPRYEFTVFQTPLWTPHAASSTTVKPGHFGPLQFTMTGNAGNTYTRTNKRTQTNGNTSFSLSQNINLNRRWSFTPSLSPSLRWQDKASAGNNASSSYRGFQGRVGTSDLLRYRPFSAMTLDNTYNWTGRMAPNHVGLDRTPSDGGVDSHNVSSFLYWRPNRVVQFRSFSGYDLRQLSDETKSAFRQRRISPWTSELTIYPSQSAWEYFARYTLGYYPLRNTQWEASAKTHWAHNTTLETGMLYNRGIPGTITWNSRFGFYVTPGWRVDAVMNALLPNGSGRKESFARMIQSEFYVTRNLHCWEARFIYRNRPPFSREVGLQVSLRFGSQAERDLADADLESQFYPWRYK